MSLRALGNGSVAADTRFGTGGFMLVFKPNAKRPPDQVESYFDLDSWVLLTIRFDPGD
jgi:hypothetical protein